MTRFHRICYSNTLSNHMTIINAVQKRECISATKSLHQIYFRKKHPRSKIKCKTPDYKQTGIPWTVTHFSSDPSQEKKQNDYFRKKVYGMTNIFQKRGLCSEGCGVCGKEAQLQCCECCVGCSETCNCCKNPSLEACLDSICPARRVSSSRIICLTNI